MDAELVYILIDQIQDLGFDRAIYLHVLGEPLLHPAVYDIVDYAFQAGMKPAIFTNGCALTREAVDRLLASRASEVVISMQTISRPSYEKLRRTPVGWNAYLGRIQAALAVANAAASPCCFRVSMGVKKADPEHPGDLFFDAHASINEVKTGIAAVFELTDVDLSGVLSQLDGQGLAELPPTILSDRLSLSVKPMGNWRRVWRDTSVTQGRCRFVGRELAVLSTGAVTLCHIDYDGRTTIGSVMGEASLADILTSPGTEEMIQDFLTGMAVAKGCEHCRGVSGTGRDVSSAP
jgi:hypothetical protein